MLTGDNFDLFIFVSMYFDNNFLLVIHANIFRSLKVAPVITQDFTTTLEERIIERIKANKFDDPQPRAAAKDVVGGEHLFVF